MGFRVRFSVIHVKEGETKVPRIAAAPLHSWIKMVAVMTWSMSQPLFNLNLNNYVMTIGRSKELCHQVDSV